MSEPPAQDPLAAVQAEPLRMNAYYYSFDPTGAVEVDRVLSAVARAGKSYHHTEGWTDDEHGPSYVDQIQAAAVAAAAALDAAEARIAAARADLIRLADDLHDEAQGYVNDWARTRALSEAKQDASVRVRAVLAALEATP